MYEVTIESLDHFGYGIAHLNKKVVFVENALPGEVVKIEIYEDKKSFSKAKVLEYVTVSDYRREPICPYFNLCGGCQFLNIAYDKTISFKKNKVKELLAKNKIDYKNDILTIENESPLYYRNKLSLKIIDGKIGFYENNSHKLVEIKECFIASEYLNKVIKNYKLLNIKNGSLTIRCNTNNEILLIINTEEKNYNIELNKLKEIVKLVGIVYNDKTIYGTSYLYERLNNMLFKISYNSFFQVNPYICKELFKLVEYNIDNESTVLDLYSGVGTLSIVASKKASLVYSIEIIKNAVLNGINNAKLNNQDNIKFMLGDVAKTVEKLDIAFDTIIVDPPRKGLDKKTLEFIKKSKPQKIIYISCDALTLMRDLKYLESLYELKSYTILDMFSYSYHLESFCVLNRL